MDITKETKALFDLAHDIKALAVANLEKSDELEKLNGDNGMMEYYNGSGCAFEAASKLIMSLAVRCFHGTIE